MSFDEDFIHDIINQAKQFLKEFNEFYPFGFKLNNDKSTKPVSLNLEEEYPASNIVIEELKIVLSQELAQNDCLAVGLCLDVKVKNEKISPDPFDAIQVCIQNRDGENADIFIVYAKTNEFYEYIEAYETPGSLDVLV